MTWETLKRPGFLGKDRDNKYKEWNLAYGETNWRLAWKWQDKYLNFVQACGIYEDAYFIFLKNNRRVLTELVSDASNIYDDAPSNVNSGTNYLVQETSHTHIQDIAIRRSLERLKESFKGGELIQIRDKKGIHPLNLVLSPGRVPFHRQDLIVSPWLDGGWCQPGSVECFYQSNRFLQVKDKRFTG